MARLVSIVVFVAVVSLQLTGSSLRSATAAGDEAGFQDLLPDQRALEIWQVRAWNDVKDPPPEGAVWKVQDGVLHGSNPRGTWLISEKTYGDFVLKLDFKIGERGNSGVGLRFPDAGDPAFDGLEVQIADSRYYGEDRVGPAELTGSLYKAIAPKKQLFKPTEWNSYEITCRGSRVKVVLNGEVIQDVNLAEHGEPLERGSPLKDRPLQGHIGFQELSRGGGHVQIRNAKIKQL